VKASDDRDMEVSAEELERLSAMIEQARKEEGVR